MENEPSHPRDYWLALAVHDDFRGVPVRKLIAQGYIGLKEMERERQNAFIRLGSLFFQGRSWRKFVGDATPVDPGRLSDAERAELEQLRSLRREVGAAFVRLLDDDETLSPATREVTLERLESMGFLE